jgi:hypothetical protein
MPQGIAQTIGSGADRFSVPGDVGYHDAGDDALAARRHVIKVTTARRRAQGLAGNPARQSRQVGRMHGQVVSAANLQTGEPANLVYLFNRHLDHPDVLSMDQSGEIQE